MQTLRVEQAGPLLESLATQLKNRTQVKKWLKLRRILVNGETAQRHDQPLAAGDVVSIGPAQRIPSVTSPRGLKIVYEDAAILLVDKPVGLLTISTDTVKTDTAYYKATEHVRRTSPDGRGRVFIVHRLDRETSGLLLFARSHEAKLTLQSGWDDVEKRYLAVVEGVPAENAGTITSHLTENRAFRVFAGPPTKRSRHAVTHYRVLESRGDRSLLEIRTETGRKHQIRVQLAGLGHPIVGDDKYGHAKSARRLGLHASFLRFEHPETGEMLEYESPLPGALRKAFSNASAK